MSGNLALVRVLLGASLGLISLSGLVAEDVGPALTGFDKVYMVDAEKRLLEAEAKVAAGPKSRYAAESSLKTAKGALDKFIARKESHATHPRTLAAQAKIAELEAAIEALKNGGAPAATAATPAAPAAAPSSELKGWAKTYMMEAEKLLAAAQASADAGASTQARAKGELSQAEGFYEKFLNSAPDQKGHPRAVAFQKGSAALAAQLAGGASSAPVASAPATPATPAPAADNPNVGKAYGGMSNYYREQVENGLKDAEYQMSRKFPKQAQKAYDNAVKIWNDRVAAKNIYIDHADLAPLRKRMVEVGEKIAGNSAASAEFEKAIPGMTAQIIAINDRLNASDLGALSRAFDSEWNEALTAPAERRAKAVAKLNGVTTGLVAAYEARLAMVPEIQATFDAYNAAFPDKQTLDVLDGGGELKHVARDLPKTIDNITKSTTKTYDYLLQVSEDIVAGMEQKLEQAGVNTANAELSKSEASLAAIYVGQAEENLNLYGSVVSGILQGLQSNPERKAQVTEVLERLDAIAGKIGKIQGDVEAANKARLQGARFPSGLSENVDPEVIAAGEQEFGTKILRAAELKPWEEVIVGRWVNNTWTVTRHKLYSLWLAKETESGKVLVYSMRFRRNFQGDGSWGPVHYYSVGSSFEILPENIEK